MADNANAARRGAVTCQHQRENGGVCVGGGGCTSFLLDLIDARRLKEGGGGESGHFHRWTVLSLWAVHCSSDSCHETCPVRKQPATHRGRGASRSSDHSYSTGFNPKPQPPAGGTAAGPNEGAPTQTPSV
jgi:hypothetical protein